MKSWGRTLALFVAVSAGAVIALLLLARLTAPVVPAGVDLPPPEMVAEIDRARHPTFDPAHPVVLYVEVDPAEGAAASWYPRGESPILRELVAAGALPPVEERTGPEPAVLRGVDGLGRYGGAWMRAANSPFDVRGITGSMSGANLVRWSPHGYPIVPHVARGWEASPDRREWTLFFRRGMRWSDGASFTVDDILYWWEHDIKGLGNDPPDFMQVRGEAGEIIRVDDYTLRFVFPHPNVLFLEILANTDEYAAPRHYLGSYHPERGDLELIERTMRARRMPTARGLYSSLKHWSNPEHPRLWPWVYRTHKSNPPQTFVRNPYYFVVDPVGNQLPYVDRVTYEIITPKLIPNAATGGRLTFQARHIRFDDYTLLMAERERGGYQVLHWFPAWRSAWTLFPNLNRHVQAGNRVDEMKHQLLNSREFRIALSVAIDREEIIAAEYHGIGEPAQLAPGRASPFHHEALLKSHTEHNPAEANRLLDGLGLARLDRDGMRTFPDGTRMIWYINFTDFTGPGPAEFVTTHWARVGIRALPRERSRPLFAAEKMARVHDFSVWSGNSEFYPLVQPRSFVPVYSESHQAQGYGIWYQLGGLYGLVADGEQGAVEPPPEHPLRRTMEVFDEALQATTLEEQIQIFQEALEINAFHCFTISIATPPPQPVIVQRGFRNVPKHAIIGGAFSMPAHAGIETFFFEAAPDDAATVAQIRREILQVTPAPSVGLADATSSTSGQGATRLLRYLFGTLTVLALVLLGTRHPYVGRRLLTMIPTLFVVSIVVFTIVQAPPGDFVQTKMLQATMTQDPGLIDEVNQIKEIFPVGEHPVVQYARWMGLKWFLTFNRSDLGLLQGNLGRSMETLRPINEMVGDQILLTFLISAGTILFTWVVAVPVGIYSAVRQYSLFDYVLTIIGFIGMCIPGFLLALIFMFLGQRWFGADLTGLFSPEFAGRAGWDWPKVVDLLKHIWVPIAVLGIGGTAGLIRVMRGNLLDELNKPYTVTARAKGVRPLRLLMKYPVRLAINPLVSAVGSVFPQLISGGAIVAIVLSLPTVGPLMLSALMTEDVYLAGSLLMVLSLLGVLGTLVSDLLLLWLDPRIRLEGGGR
jgi:ABC-type dipeptide/oligopeptide/nickel transport system permease component/ABC-type transport system substrate-binding protein